MIKITIGTPGVTDGTSYYRAAGPFNKLRKQIKDLHIDYPGAFGWHDMGSSDIFFCQRPGSEDHLKIIELAKKCHTPVWVDMDDDLLDVPQWNPGWETFKDRGHIVKECLKLADVVTTATEHLAKKFREYNKNTIVIPNALDEDLIKAYDPICKPVDQSTIYWRGSHGHIKDIMLVEEDLCDIAKEFPKLKWQFHGYWPWHTFEAFAKLKLNISVDKIKTWDIPDYFQYFCKGNGEAVSTHSIGIVPLEDIPWNHHKSNIAWIENTLAGACTLALDTHEFQKPGCATYKSGQFKEALLFAISRSDKERKAHVQSSLEYIQEHLTLSVINKTRIEIIDSLLSK